MTFGMVPSEACFLARWYVVAVSGLKMATAGEKWHYTLPQEQFEHVFLTLGSEMAGERRSSRGKFLHI